MKPRRRPVGHGERARRHHGWLELVQTSGPWLTLPVVDRILPDGPPAVADRTRAELRTLVDTMQADGGGSRDQVIAAVLDRAFGWGDHLRRSAEIPAALAEAVPDHAEILRPTFAFYAHPVGENVGESDLDGASDDDVSDPDADEDGDLPAEPSVNATGPWRLLGMTSPWGTHPLTRVTIGGWAASPVDRLAVLLRARDVPIGVVTDGRWWALVWAPRGATTAAAVWDAGLWSEEPETLRGLVVLLNRARFLAVAAADQLPALFAESLDRQEEVTESLGRQVRDAVELLVGALDALDADSDRTLLEGVSDDDFYDGAVTVMMRIVFLLFAEERRLLPSDDATYVDAYSIGRLVDQLESRATLAGEAALEHRSGAWHRLLAVSRALHSGVAHEDLRLPAYGGGLFDPDRYPWLEGRQPGEAVDGSHPPAVDDRTVLRMLRAVQYVTVNGERRRLTFRALDVEQIGYVYEGLLELEVRTATEPVLALIRATDRKKQKAPAEVPVSEALDAVASIDRKQLAAWLVERTGWTPKRATASLDIPSTAEARAALLVATGKDEELADQLLPLAAALRLDERVQPIVIPAGGRYIAPSRRRAATGTHYTPRSLAEDVANNTLEPLVYRPGPLETADRKRWHLRPSSEILAVRVADIAMGSGAFLVAACRYLADRLVEAWDREGRVDAARAVVARQGVRPTADVEVEPILLDARRLVTEHCLYGVDINPLAVEMAKLSLWLVTMDRERPFGFLDDRLRAGDSLLGLVSTAQLETVHVDPAAGQRLHQGSFFDIAGYMRPILQDAADLRRRITAQPVVTIRDIEHKASLLAEADSLTDRLSAAADAIAGTGLTAAAGKKGDVERAFYLAADRVASALDHGDPTLLRQEADADLQRGRPPGTALRRPLHWPLAFPEVFADAPDPGFDAIIGNPPFLGGHKVSGHLGDDYRAWLTRWDGKEAKGRTTDLVAFFVLRACRLLCHRGQLGYIATNTLVQGDTFQVGLLQAAQEGLAVRRGESSHKWPSRFANLEIVTLWASHAPVKAGALRWLDGEEVPSIGPDLEPVGQVPGRPFALVENDDLAFNGSKILGNGFVLTPEQADATIQRDVRYREILQPYVIGKDLNQRPDCSASRWIINFRDWSLERCEQFPEALDIVRRLVKPQRDLLPDYKRRVRDAWWRYEHIAPTLYETVADLDHVLAISLVSNVVQPVRVQTGQVFAHKCGVFAFDDFANLAILASSAHTVWVVRYTSTMRTDINYSPSDVFLTFPRPRPTSEIEDLGQTLDTERRELMLSRAWGLTTTYNHVHDPADTDPAVLRLREIHAAIDRAVFDAYGWTDLDPQIGHHRNKIGVRWTVSPEVRFEILDRLLAENHRRHGDAQALQTNKSAAR